MVADALIYHPSVSHYLKFVATTVGRDKLLRLVQYFARFYSWYLLRTNATTASIAPWSQTKKQLGLIRKFMRIGKNVEHLKAAAQASDAKTFDPVLKYTSVGRQLGYAGYLTFDAGTVLDAAGIRKWEGAKRMQVQAFRFWAAGLTFSVVAQLYTLYRLRVREARIDKKDGEGVVESKRITKERAASHLQLLSDVCDLTVPASALGWIALDDGVVGLAGTVSSVLGIYTQWKKTA
jgi:peroxin-11B